MNPAQVGSPFSFDALNLRSDSSLLFFRVTSSNSSSLLRRPSPTRSSVSFRFSTILSRTSELTSQRVPDSMFGEGKLPQVSISNRISPIASFADSYVHSLSSNTFSILRSLPTSPLTATNVSCSASLNLVCSSFADFVFSSSSRRLVHQRVLLRPELPLPRILGTRPSTRSVGFLAVRNHQGCQGECFFALILLSFDATRKRASLTLCSFLSSSLENDRGQQRLGARSHLEDQSSTRSPPPSPRQDPRISHLPLERSGSSHQPDELLPRGWISQGLPVSTRSLSERKRRGRGEGGGEEIESPRRLNLLVDRVRS